MPRPSPLRALLVLLLTCGLAAGPSSLLPLGPTPLAWADDDGDDGGDDDDGGTSGGGSGGGDRDDRDDREDRTGGDDGDRRSGLARLRDSLFGRTDPPADRDDRFRPGEILAVDLSSEARGRLVRLGFEVLDQRRLGTLGLTVTRLAPPSDRPLLEALELARSTDPATVFDLNHLYRGLLCEGC